MRKHDYIILLILAAVLIVCITVGATAIIDAAGTVKTGGSIGNGGVEVYDTRDEIKLPILMYHGLTDDAASESEYVISAARFESDLQWLRDNGFTSVFPEELVEYAKNGNKLPEKPILLTFDDGYVNNMIYGQPLLSKYNMKAVIAIIGADTTVSSDDIYRPQKMGSLTWGEIALMADSNIIEFANHTYSMHEITESRKGANIAKGESASAYSITLAADIEKNQEMIERASGKRPIAFAWPYGAYPIDGSGDEIIQKLGIPLTYNSYQRTSVIKKGDIDSLLGMGRYLRTPEFDLREIVLSFEE